MTLHILDGSGVAHRLFFSLAFCCLVISVDVTSIDSAEPPSDGDYPHVKHLIDTHIHLYDPRRPDGVPWPPSTDKVLFKPHLPKEFRAVSKTAGVTGVVIVEASHRLEDNRWMLDLVDGNDLFIALVGNVDLTRDDFEQQITKLAQDKRFVGVRARSPEPIDFSAPKILANVRSLAKHKLSMDFLCNGQGIKGVKTADALARAVPNLRIIVNHVLGYDIDGQKPSQEWLEAVTRLAANKNVFCKVSGLYQRCVQQPAPQEIAKYESLLDALWERFGQERLIYGSNWPCTKKSGDYGSFVRLVNGYFAKRGQNALEDYFWRNASAAYRLPLK